MPGRSRILSAAVMVLIASVCAGATPKQAIPPLPEGLVKGASEAIDQRTLKDFAVRVQQQIEPLLAGSGGLNQQPERVLPLATMREFARYFGRLAKPSPSDTATLKWLLAHPQLLTTLMMCVSEKDAPDKVLAVLSNLREDQKDRLEEYPDLTSAICVVWDQPYEQARGSMRPWDRPADPMRPRNLMRLYVNARSQMRFNPQQLSWQLAVYMVDNLADPEDIEWALNRYGGHGRIGGTFFDVEYDTEGFRGTMDRQLTEKDYTLQNILKHGGLCGDQAYYAAHVARSIGVPATICTGANADEGTGHAWVGYLGTRSGQSTWDFDEGRYPENRYWRGSVTDPQTREKITDADVSLLAELEDTQQLQRLTSTAIGKVIDIAAAAQQPALLMQAINLSPGNRKAWYLLAEQGAKQKLTVKQSNDLTAAVSKFAAREYPDFAFNVLKLANTGRGTAEQIKALDDMPRMFNNRPDIIAEVRIAQGDLYYKEKRYREAMDAYDDVLNRNLNIAPIIMQALDHVDKMLRELRALPQLADVYEDVWKHLPQPDVHIAVQGTPFYRIGERYERLLRDLGETNTAQNVRSRLDAMTTSVTVLQRDRSR